MNKHGGKKGKKGLPGENGTEGRSDAPDRNIRLTGGEDNQVVPLDKLAAIRLYKPSDCRTLLKEVDRVSTWRKRALGPGPVPVLEVNRGGRGEVFLISKKKIAWKIGRSDERSIPSRKTLRCRETEGTSTSLQTEKA